MSGSGSFGSRSSDPQPAWLLVQPPESGFRKWTRRLLWVGLVLSILLNISLFAAVGDYFTKPNGPIEKYHSGDRVASDKIAIVKIHGTIMPPFTERILRIIEKVKDDDAVKGVLLSIDSPGGLVADSHQIYHRLQELNVKKPIAVQMKRLAASGGYYVAMGAGVDGKIFAEETTWTGSIGVIIPRYDLTEAAKKLGVASDPLKTGPLKDALSPFRELSPEERAVWDEILKDAFGRFQGVIVKNRKGLDPAKVKEVATGQIFTAEQAKQHGLIDEIGFEEDSIKWLQEKCELKTARVVTYENQQTLLEQLLGVSFPAKPASELSILLDASVPRAFYFCSWGAGLSTAQPTP